MNGRDVCACMAFMHQFKTGQASEQVKRLGSTLSHAALDNCGRSAAVEKEHMVERYTHCAHSCSLCFLARRSFAACIVLSSLLSRPTLLGPASVSLVPPLPLLPPPAAGVLRLVGAEALPTEGGGAPPLPPPLLPPPLPPEPELAPGAAQCCPSAPGSGGWGEGGWCPMMYLSCSLAHMASSSSSAAG